MGNYAHKKHAYVQQVREARLTVAFCFHLLSFFGLHSLSFINFEFEMSNTNTVKTVKPTSYMQTTKNFVRDFGHKGLLYILILYIKNTGLGNELSKRDPHETDRLLAIV